MRCCHTQKWQQKEKSSDLNRHFKLRFKELWEDIEVGQCLINVITVSHFVSSKICRVMDFQITTLKYMMPQ